MRREDVRTRIQKKEGDMKTRLLGITGAKFKHLLVATFLTVTFLFLGVPKVEAQFIEAGVQKFKTPVDAADFTLKELGGKEISLRELRGKVILLNFFHTW